MGLVQKVPGYRCSERGNRRNQLRDLAEHVAGVQVPCLPHDPFGGRRGRVHLPILRWAVAWMVVRWARAAVVAQTQPNGFRRVLLGLAHVAKVPVGPGSVTQVAAFVEVQPFRLRPVSGPGDLAAGSEGGCRWVRRRPSPPCPGHVRR
jgi:hypothetical protein